MRNMSVSSTRHQVGLDMSSLPESAGRLRIAIVVVTLNCLPLLEETVCSIRALADPRIDPILIDGASTDGTAERVIALRGWARYAISEPDRGIYDAMNKGWLAAAHDSYVLYLGAGDTILELPPDRDLTDAAGEPYPLVMGHCSVGDVPFHSRWGTEMRLRNTAHHQALLVRRSLCATAPFDPGLRVYGDWDFNLRLLNRGLRARHVHGLRTHACTGGVSWRHDLAEIRKVASRHSGIWAGVAAYALNGVSRWRRDRSLRHGR